MGVPNCGFCEIGYSVRIRGILWGPGENGLLKCWILSELCCNSTAALFSCVSAKLSISMHPKSLGGSPIQDSLQKAAEEIRATADGESRSVLDFPVMGEGPRVFFPIISPPANEPHSKRRGKLNGENGD